MNLPENKKRNVEIPDHKVVWIYGKPFSGKTTFASNFPDVLMLNTDGNIQFIDSPYISIKDKVETMGRLTKRQFAWETFKETVKELEKKENTYKTIVIDLIEDLYDMCRVYEYDQMGIHHESDEPFKSYDIIRNEFFRELKKLTAAGYENIVFISHEDESQIISRKTATTKSGMVTYIKPNITNKVANKISGMCTVVGRVIIEDGERKLTFSPDENVFSGGRISNMTIPLTYEALDEIYKK